MNTKTENSRLPVLDLLRFIAAFSVMIMHIFQRGFANDKFYDYSFGFLSNVFKYNYLAVNLFFLISGYVILLTAQNRTLKQFTISRFLRLYPAYWLACTISFVVSYCFLKEVFQPTIARYAINMTMFNGFFGVGYIDGVYWTLLVELKFYLLTMLLIYFNFIAKTEKILWIWLAISVANYYLQNAVLTKILITDFASFFCIGAMLFIMSSDNFKLNYQRAAFLIVAFVLGFFNEKHALILRSEHFGAGYDSVTLLFILISILFVFVYAISKQNITSPLGKIFQKLGKSSYPLYLIHLNISLATLRLLAIDGEGRYYVALLLVTLMPLIAYAIAIYFEDPVRERIKRILLNTGLKKTLYHR